MIFNDKVNLTLKEKRTVNGTMTTVVVFQGDVPAIVTFLDSKTAFDPAGGKISSRLRIVLSPVAFEIPPMPASGLVVVTYRQFTSLTIDGMVEPHYLNGRLHHYEFLARAV
ncbi:hypothetical protein [Mycolicibacterium fortuitum]|uniref:hypothetical protein n=1 Tax=Mycolicibacterium fortuitum TaxID=1766 RepID=UPI0009005490|nr:hypothetical protein [Mycolicibacterium fortuitum]